MFLAHGGATSGHMCGEVCSGMRNIREIHILSAKAAIEAGADIVMTAYNTIDGVLCVASKEILTDLLRDELGFEGVVMTDGGGVLRARDVVRGGADYLAAAVAFNAGNDVSLGDAWECFYILRRLWKKAKSQRKNLTRQFAEYCCLK